ncbi:MAG TPA: MMPL family transporter [Gaiellaceae bacterium]
MNLAARAARWSAAHWKTATFGWLALAVAAVVAGSIVGTRKLTDSETSTGEAAQAQQILTDAGIEDRATESVLVQSKSSTVGDPAFRRTVDSVVTALKARHDVTGVRSPLAGGNAAQISRDRHSALVQFDLEGEVETAGDRIQPVLDEVKWLQRTHSGFTIEEFGRASADHALNDATGKDLARAEHLSLPITFLILLLAFGAFVAAGVPVLLAFSAVLASIGLSSVLSHVAHASSATSSVILLMGMAVGVDYSLFYLKREREERARGSDGPEALRRAASTSGQAVLIAGATVLVAMAGMLFAGSKIFTSIGVGAMIVVFVSMIGSLTVLPALLGKLGDRVDRGVIAVLAAAVARRWKPRWLLWLRDRRTLLQVLKGKRSESRVWGLVLRPAMRFPGAAVVASVAVLVALAVPAFGMHTSIPGFADLPKSVGLVRTYDAVQHAFPGSQTPAEIVVKGPNLRSPEAKAAFSELQRRAIAAGAATGKGHTFVDGRGTVARVEIPIAGDGDNSTSVAALDTLRSKVVPAALDGLPATEYAITGETAGNHDFNQTVKSRAPLVFVFVLGIAFLLLLITFRSIVIPIKAILLNLLSVGAAYGVLVWIFQDGHFEGLLNYHSNGAVASWVPLFLFPVLFGLSMDYHVFILSRVKELVDRGVPTDEAVRRGIRGTAGTVTSAAAVMVAVFAIFATLQQLDIKQMGVGLAVAVFIDATLIRAVLLPATMKLLGDWNWYLPRWLRWLPARKTERVHGRLAVDAR